MVDRPDERTMVRTFINNLQAAYSYSAHLRYQNLRTFEDLDELGLQIEDDIRRGTVPKAPSKGYQGPTTSHTYGNKVDEIHLIEKAADKPKATVRKQRTYSPLGMTYSLALTRLTNQGLLKLLGPTPDPSADKKSASWDAKAYCKYHQGKGHDTEKCWRLKNDIQDLIDSGKLPVPPEALKANNKSNPLVGHPRYQSRSHF